MCMWLLSLMDTEFSLPSIASSLEQKTSVNQFRVLFLYFLGKRFLSRTFQEIIIIAIFLLSFLRDSLNVL